MTTTSEARVHFDESEVVTPRLRSSLRRALFWILIAVMIVLLALAGLLVGTSATTGQATLSATNPGAGGAEALINVLRDDGVNVTAPRTLKTAARDAGNADGPITVAVYDPSSILSHAQLEQLRSIAPNLVLIEPSAHELAVLAPNVSEAGAVALTAKADCDYRPVTRAGTVSGLQNGYRVDSGASAAVRCLGSDSVYSLVRVRTQSQTVTVLGSSAILTNKSITTAGNAALALGMFGSTKNLVWYLPSLADVAGTKQDGSISPPVWVFILEVLGAVTFLAAAVWRGRRLGPVVVERMPVAVRSNETMEGRARLYQKASARSHALDALRIGTISRISTLLGLPKLATVDEVIGATTALTGRDSAELRELLLDAVPTTDLRLVHLSDQLLQLEAQVRQGVTPQ